MEDLREVGQNSLDAINKLGASDVGDLVLGIGNLIEELHDTPEDKREGKLEHLRGLFREFAHGEEYEYRDERLEPRQPEDPNNVTGMLPPVNPNALFGGQNPIASWSDIAVSGLGAISGVYSLPRPIPSSTCVEEEPKKFVKHWWNSQVSVEEQLDNEDVN